MKRFLNAWWPEIVLLLSASSMLLMLCGCERLSPEQEVAVKTATGAAGAVAGLPPWVGESVGGIIIAAIAAFAGHKHGKRRAG
jgi:hypothetical protein